MLINDVSTIKIIFSSFWYNKYHHTFRFSFLAVFFYYHSILYGTTCGDHVKIIQWLKNLKTITFIWNKICTQIFAQTNNHTEKRWKQLCWAIFTEIVPLYIADYQGRHVERLSLNMQSENHETPVISLCLSSSNDLIANNIDYRCGYWQRTLVLIV